MKLTKSADYAMRLLLHLAKTNNAETMPNLSEKLYVSYNNIVKLVQKLNKGGLVCTIQGKLGGVLLALPAKDITLKQVIDIIDGPTQLVECASQKTSCELVGCCELQGVFDSLQSKINDHLQSVNLAHVLENSYQEVLG